MDSKAWNTTFNIIQNVIYRRDSGGDLYTYTRSDAFFYIPAIGASHSSGDHIMLNGVDYPVSLERVRAV